MRARACAAYGSSGGRAEAEGVLPGRREAGRRGAVEGGAREERREECREELGTDGLWLEGRALLLGRRSLGSAVR